MGSALLVTGCTGTFGRAFLRRALLENRWPRIVAFSRDEVKQAALRAEFGDGPRLFLGDVRDADRLGMAMRNVDTVVHAAALKRVDAGAYSPSEMIATNVVGTMNVVNAAIQAGVRRVVILSSDKACAPTNIYGMSKGLAECYATHANAYGYPTGTRVAAVRYGNILGSRGSVIGIWQGQVARKQPVTLTDRRMTRFAMTIEQACDLVLFALAHMGGGEVFVPLLPSMRMADLAQAVAGTADYPVVECGMRPGGEKLAESLLNEEEPTRTRRLDADTPCYVVAPSQHEWTTQGWAGVRVAPDLVYRSDGPWQHYLSVEELRALMEGTQACQPYLPMW